MLRPNEDLLPLPALHQPQGPTTVMDPLFSEEDRQRIAEAIEEAETDSVAEIVPYVVARSGDYPAARWRGAVLGALLGGALTLLLRGASPSAFPPFFSGALAFAAPLVTGLLGALAAGMSPSLVRMLTPSAELERAVFRRAVQAFVEEEVFATRNRTGILLFVSLLERRIEVLADRGIDELVGEAAWTDVTDHVRRGIETDRLTRGLLNGIDRCAAVLEERGADTRPDDENELADRLRRGGQRPSSDPKA